MSSARELLEIIPKDLSEDRRKLHENADQVDGDGDDEHAHVELHGRIKVHKDNLEPFIKELGALLDKHAAKSEKPV